MTAAYASWCTACWQRIKAGDTIARTVAGGWIHETCPDAVTVAERPVCGTCFLEVAVNGQCGCPR